jgi:flagellar basal body rod protein FlgC
LKYDLCQVALEAQALRLRTTEDHLAAEKQAAEETEALVMQRHQAALQALETKHQLGSLGFVSCF